MILQKKYFTKSLLFLTIVGSCFTLTTNVSSLDGSNLLSKTNMTPVRKNYPHLEEPVGPYVHAVEYNHFLFLSGITAFGTTAQKGTISEQADVIYSQIASIAAAENVNLSNLIKVTIYITSFDDLESLRATLFKHYGSALPASSLVQVKRLFSPDLKIEVEATLALN